MFDEPIPAEAVGKARVLLQKIRAADERVADAATHIGGMFKARLARKPTLRPEGILDIARYWQNKSPSEYRIVFDWRSRPQRRPIQMQIGECRLSYSESRVAGWRGFDEPGVAVILIWASTYRGKLHGGLYPPFALVSQRAIARRFERGRDRSESAVVRDLSGLLYHRSELAVTVGDGIWLADPTHKTENGHRYFIPNFRTYLDRDQFDDEQAALRAVTNVAPPREVVVR